jgi:hypothetical protein
MPVMPVMPLMAVMQLTPVTPVIPVQQNCLQALLAPWLLVDDPLQAPSNGCRFA